MASGADQTNHDIFRGCVADPILQLYHLPISATSRKRPDGKLIWLAWNVKSTFYSKSEAEDAEASIRERDMPYFEDFIQNRLTREVKSNNFPGGEADTMKAVGRIQKRACLEEFVHDISMAIFVLLPQDLQTLTPSAVQQDYDLIRKQSANRHFWLRSKILDAIPPSIGRSLKDHSIISELDHPNEFFVPVMIRYVEEALVSKAESCGLCTRKNRSLQGHHLTPRSLWPPAPVKSLHGRRDLKARADLCESCHMYVHRFASNQELAADYWNVGLLMKNERVLQWTRMLGRVARTFK